MICRTFSRGDEAGWHLLANGTRNDVASPASDPGRRTRGNEVFPCEIDLSSRSERVADFGPLAARVFGFRVGFAFGGGSIQAGPGPRCSPRAAYRPLDSAP